jgi:hypothetical protein
VDVLRRDQDIHLLETPLQMSLEFHEEPLSLSIGAGKDFNLDDVLDEIYAAIFPSLQVRSGLRTDGPRSEDGDYLFTNLFDFLSFDFPTIVLLQRHVNLILFQAAKGD